MQARRRDKASREACCQVKFVGGIRGGSWQITAKSGPPTENQITGSQANCQTHRLAGCTHASSTDSRYCGTYVANLSFSEISVASLRATRSSPCVRITRRGGSPL